MWPEQQKDERQGIGEPVFDCASEGGTPKDLGDFLANPDNQAANDCAGYRGEAAKDQYRQRFQRH